MHSLASFIMRGPKQAITASAALALISLFPLLSFFSYGSAAVIALVALRRGVQAGATVLVGALVVLAVISYLVTGSMILVAVFVLLLWLPALLLAQLLRSTNSWSLLLDLLALLGIVAVAAFYIATPDPAEWWRDILTQLSDILAAQTEASLDSVRLGEQMTLLAGAMTGLLAAMVVSGVLISLLVARWWQSMLYNPGGFRKEFFGLRLSRAGAIAAAGVLAMTVMGSNLAADAMIVVAVVMAVCGLALIHAVVAALNKSMAWLVGLYIIIAFALPKMVVMLALLGFIDVWGNFRARLPTKGNGSDE